METASYDSFLAAQTNRHLAAQANYVDFSEDSTAKVEQSTILDVDSLLPTGTAMKLADCFYDDISQQIVDKVPIGKLFAFLAAYGVDDKAFWAIVDNAQGDAYRDRHEC